MIVDIDMSLYISDDTSHDMIIPFLMWLGCLLGAAAPVEIEIRRWTRGNGRAAMARGAAVFGIRDG